MDEKLRPRKASPHSKTTDSQDTASDSYPQAETQGESSRGNTTDEGLRTFRPRRNDIHIQPDSRSNPDRRASHSSYQSRYDEVQPRNNASRQEFEQQQNRYQKRYEHQPRNYTSAPAPYPRSNGYGSAPQRYNPTHGYQDRYSRGGAESNRYTGRENNFVQKNFKKAGKHSNDPLPKKVKIPSIPLIQALGKLRYASRNISLQTINEGVVEINGVTTTKQNAPVRLGKDIVKVNNISLTDEGILYIAFNKQKKVNGSAEAGEQSIVNLLHKKEGWYFPAGCLNRAASGVVIVTNDPAHKNLGESPIAASEKEYHIKVHKKVAKKEADLLKKHFLKLQTSSFSVSDVRIVRDTARHSWLAVITERGKLAEIRKVLKDFGLEVISFERYRVGGFTADDLLEGSWKRLTQDEINLLQSSSAVVLQEEEPSGESDTTKPKWQKLYQQWFKSI